MTLCAGGRPANVKWYKITALRMMEKRMRFPGVGARLIRGCMSPMRCCSSSWAGAAEEPCTLGSNPSSTPANSTMHPWVWSCPIAFPKGAWSCWFSSPKSPQADPGYNWEHSLDWSCTSEQQHHAPRDMIISQWLKSRSLAWEEGGGERCSY